MSDTGLTDAEQAAFDRHLAAEEAKPDAVIEWYDRERAAGRVAPGATIEEVAAHLADLPHGPLREVAAWNALRAYFAAKGWRFGGQRPADLPDDVTLAKRASAALNSAHGWRH